MPSEYKVVYTASAKNTLDKILGYITNILSNLTAAKKLYNDFISVIDNISSYPYAMPQAKYKGKRNYLYRKIIIKNFIAIYRIDENEKIIYILTFRYAPKEIGDKI